MKPSLYYPAALLHGVVAGAGAQLQQDGQQFPLHQGSVSQHAGNVGYGSDEVPVADDEFVKYIEEQMKTWHVPGLAMAILDGNKTWSKGFGYASLDEEVNVTSSTLFYCGSMTKSFTAAALSLLVDDPSPEYASVQWNKAVSSLLPDEFVLSDPWATNHITIADALSHSTGYPRHDFSGPYHNSSADMVRAFRHLPMSQEPRAKWQYNNMMYGTMGYVIEQLTNTTLANFFRDKLWRPMGMLSTYLHPDDALASNSTLSHAYYWNNDTESYGKIPWSDETNIAGAGMSISSVLDWSRYLRHMMDESGPISKAGHTAVKSSQAIANDTDRLFVGPVYYGFGWNGGVFANERAWWHSGMVNSMMSYMLIVPSRGLGFVLMMNSEGIQALDGIVARTLYDYFGVDVAKRVDIEGEWKKVSRKDAESLANCSARLYPSMPSPSLPPMAPLEDFAGEYHDPGYGTISVEQYCDGWVTPSDSPAAPSLTEAGCMLVIRKASVFAKGISYQLEHKSGDLWVGWLFNDDYATVKRPMECLRVEFHLGETGSPKKLGLDVRLEGDEQPLVWFGRVDPIGSGT